MPLCGIGFSVAGLGKIAKRLLDLRIGGGGGGGGGGGDPEPPPALEDGPANNLYVRGPVDFPLTNNAHNSFNNVLTLQEGVSFDTVSIGVNFGVGIYNNDIYVFGFSSNYRLGNGLGGNTGVYHPYTSSLPGSAVDYWGEASCGSGFGVAIRRPDAGGAPGTMWSWGNSMMGGLGLGATNTATTRTQIGTDNTWRKVFCGGDSAFAIKSDGTLWAWGYNNKGQLGLGNLVNRTSPTQVGTDTNWDYVSVGSGGYNVTALKTDGSIWFAGSNLDRNSGLGSGQSTGDVTTFTQIGTDTDWVKVKNGNAVTLAIKSNGTLWGWGGNYTYALASSGTKFVPTQIGTDTWIDVDSEANTTWAIKSDGTLWSTGSGGSGKNGNPTVYTNYTTFTQYGTATNWSWVVRGRDNFLFKNSLGEIYHVGAKAEPKNRLNSFTFEKYDESTWSKILLYEMGFVGLKPNHTLWAGKKDGSYYTGLGLGFLQIGTDTWKDFAIHGTEDGLFQVSGIKTDGTLWQLGLDRADSTRSSTTFRQISSDTTWKSVVSNPNVMVALKEDGTVWAYGNNQYGGLGQGNTTLNSSLVQVGSSTWSSIWLANNCFFMINSSGTMYSWCESTQNGGFLNRPLPSGDVSEYTPGEVNGGAVWKQVKAYPGGLIIAAIKTNGTLWTWSTLAQTVNNIPANATATQIGTATDWVDAIVKTYYVEGFKGASTWYATAFGIRGSNGKGDLYAWGDTTVGAAGLDKSFTTVSFPSATSPTLIESGNFTQIVSAPNFDYAGTSTNIMDIALKEAP